MNIEEAEEWIRGERSWWNQHANVAPNQGENFVNCERQDTASTERAYWILRAYKEGLVKADTQMTPTEGPK